MGFEELTPSKAETRTYSALFIRQGEDVVAARLYVNGSILCGRLIPAGYFFRLFPEVSTDFERQHEELYLTEVSELFGEDVADRLFNELNEGGIWK